MKSGNIEIRYTFLQFMVQVLDIDLYLKVIPRHVFESIFLFLYFDIKK